MAEELPFVFVPEEAGENVATHSDGGVDLTLIRWMLNLPPAERLAWLQTIATSCMRLRRAARSS